MGDCKDGSCSTGSMECCDTGSDCGPKRPSCGCDMTDQLMDIADKAWEHLMIEKMKKLWEKERGPHMDKMAEAAVANSMEYWENVMKSKHAKHEARERTKKSMMH